MLTHAIIEGFLLGSVIQGVSGFTFRERALFILSGLSDKRLICMDGRDLHDAPDRQIPLRAVQHTRSQFQDDTGSALLDRRQE